MLLPSVSTAQLFYSTKASWSPRELPGPAMVCRVCPTYGLWQACPLLLRICFLPASVSLVETYPTIAATVPLILFILLFCVGYCLLSPSYRVLAIERIVYCLPPFWQWPELWPVRWPVKMMVRGRRSGRPAIFTIWRFERFSKKSPKVWCDLTITICRCPYSTS